MAKKRAAAAGTNTVTPQAIWDELVRQGATTDEAAGIMGNFMDESSFNPEAVNPAGPQAGVGLAQWKTTFYPGAAHLVTGNPHQDMVNQIRFLAQTKGFQAARGGSPGASGGSFAQNYEKCQTCYPGGAEYQARVANAIQVAQWAKSGKWPAGAPPPGPGPSATVTAYNASTCIFGFPGIPVPLLGNIGQFCIFTKSEARAIIGAGLLWLGGIGIGLPALFLLIAGAGMAAAGPLGPVAEKTGAAVALIPGAEGAGVAIAGAGKAAGSSAKQTQARRAGKAKTRKERSEEITRQQKANPAPRPEPPPERPWYERANLG